MAFFEHVKLRHSSSIADIAYFVTTILSVGYNSILCPIFFRKVRLCLLFSR